MEAIHAIGQPTPGKSLYHVRGPCLTQILEGTPPVHRIVRVYQTYEDVPVWAASRDEALAMYRTHNGITATEHGIHVSDPC